jgi:peptidoglycan-associated lipoprotein
MLLRHTLKKTSQLVAITAIGLLAAACSSTKNNGTDGDASSDTAGLPVTTETPLASLPVSTIYFDFNKYEIRHDQHAHAAAIAASLKAASAMKVVIEGHCDDRGSAEYNLALGEKRATSLKNFLTASGVSGDNVSTVSFGKERPAVPGNNEEAWAKNRRDEVVVSSK